MKKYLLAFIIGVFSSGCATQAIVQKSSCSDVHNEDEMRCKKVLHLFR